MSALDRGRLAEPRRQPTPSQPPTSPASNFIVALPSSGLTWGADPTTRHWKGLECPCALTDQLRRCRPWSSGLALRLACQPSCCATGRPSTTGTTSRTSSSSFSCRRRDSRYGGAALATPPGRGSSSCCTLAKRTPAGRPRRNRLSGCCCACPRGGSTTPGPAGRWPSTTRRSIRPACKLVCTATQVARTPAAGPASRGRTAGVHRGVGRPR